MKGKYTITVPIGASHAVASKDGYISQTVENINVTENQTSILNFELIGGEENMEHIVDVNVTNDNEETVIIPDGVALKTYRVVGSISGNIQIGKTVELLTADGITILQSQITDANGIVIFVDVIYGEYKLKIRD